MLIRLALPLGIPGVDITQTLRNAIAQLPITGGAIEIPSGQWVVSEPVVVSGKNIHIKGDSLSSAIVVAHAGPGLIFRDARWSSLSNLHVIPTQAGDHFAVMIERGFVFKMNTILIRGDLPGKERIQSKGLFVNGSSIELRQVDVGMGGTCLHVNGLKADGTYEAGFLMEGGTLHPTERNPSTIPLLVESIPFGDTVLSMVNCYGGSRAEFRNIKNGSLSQCIFTDSQSAALFASDVQNVTIGLCWFGGNDSGLDMRGSNNAIVGCQPRGAANFGMRLGGSGNIIQACRMVVNASAGKSCLIIDPTATTYSITGNTMECRGGAWSKPAVVGHVAGSQQKIMANNLSLGY